MLSLVVLVAPSLARGDEFDRLDGGVLAGLLRNAHTRTRTALGFRDLEALPAVVCDTRSAS